MWPTKRSVALHVQGELCLNDYCQTETEFLSYDEKYRLRQKNLRVIERPFPVQLVRKYCLLLGWNCSLNLSIIIRLNPLAFTLCTCDAIYFFIGHLKCLDLSLWTHNLRKCKLKLYSAYGVRDNWMKTFLSLLLLVHAVHIYTLVYLLCEWHILAEWPPVWERAVHSVYRACLS